MNYVYGKNAVKQMLDNKNVVQVFLSENNLSEFKTLLVKNKVKYSVVFKDKLNKLANTDKHQGIVLELKEYKTYQIEEIFRDISGNGLIIMLDGLEDPHNLGAILRTADAVGADGVIYGKNRSVSLNSTVAKVSTGAIDTIKVSEVTNLNQTIKTLKDNGFWIVGVELGGTDFRSMKYDMPICLVIGSEGKGISRLVKENCDFLVSIPMRGYVNSLNASVAAALVMYEIDSQRK